MSGASRQQKRQKHTSQGFTRCQLQANGVNHESNVPPCKTTVALAESYQSANRSMGATPTKSSNTTRTVSKRVLPYAIRNEDCDRSRIHSYLHSCSAMYLLENIPRAEHVSFVEQDLLSHAQPKKLLIGHHAQNGDDIFAYMVPMSTFHKVEFYTEDAQGCTKLRTSTEMVVRHRILHPFNWTYPRDPRTITQADTARLALVVKWYFVSAGIVQACFPEERKTFGKRFCAALRYIASESNPALDRPSHTGFMQQPPHNYAGRKRSAPGIHIDESDIQSSLLQMYSPVSRTFSAGARSVQQSPGSPPKVPFAKARVITFELPKDSRCGLGQGQVEAYRMSETVDWSKPRDHGASSLNQNNVQQHFASQEKGQSAPTTTREPSKLNLYASRGWCDWLKVWLFS